MSADEEFSRRRILGGDILLHATKTHTNDNHYYPATDAGPPTGGGYIIVHTLIL